MHIAFYFCLKPSIILLIFVFLLLVGINIQACLKLKCENISDQLRRYLSQLRATNELSAFCTKLKYQCQTETGQLTHRVSFVFLLLELKNGLKQFGRATKDVDGLQVRWKNAEVLYRSQAGYWALLLLHAWTERAHELPVQIWKF